MDFHTKLSNLLFCKRKRCEKINFSVEDDGKTKNFLIMHLSYNDNQDIIENHQ